MANERPKTASFGPGFLGAILLFCAFAVVAWILFRFAALSPTYEEKRAQARRDKVAAINAEAADKLYSPPKWIDKTKGTIQLPIDTAMDLVVNDYQTKPVAPSQVKVDNPYPYGLQMAAAAPAAPSTTSTSSKTPTPSTPSPEVKK
jgi:hypothetical protein